MPDGAERAHLAKLRGRRCRRAMCSWLAGPDARLAAGALSGRIWRKLVGGARKLVGLAAGEAGGCGARSWRKS